MATLMACYGGPPPKDDVGECDVDEDCPSGFFCDGDSACAIDDDAVDADSATPADP
ncbi:MAG: hypothetical protein U0271_14760 [Polyangiaceae bacterium]